MKGEAAAPRIVVRNAQRKLPLQLPELQRFAECALQQLWRSLPARCVRLRGIEEISAILVSDRRIAQLHRRFMNIAGPTDVITFHHGEIFISVETAAAHAQQFHSTLEPEVRLYLVHGILHLLGFDDTSARAARAMEAMQTRIVAAASKAAERTS